MSNSLPQNLEQLRQVTEQFQAGAISAARFQAVRVPQGVYEQREPGTYMLRARLVAGILTPAQMRVAAEVAESYGSGLLHFTSRQDLQVHGVRLAGIYPAVLRLTEAGLSTNGGGGNTVRNIAACYQAGVCPDEIFDITPSVIGLTESLLSDPLSFQLPRKYKLAFSGCGRDCAGATVNDLGFIARESGGARGFAVYAGGGMGAHSSVGRLLRKFVLEEEACQVAEAVKRVFDKYGNRKNRHRARLRFLIEDLGFEAFERLYREEFGSIEDRPLGADQPPRSAARRASVLPQKQAGYFSVEVAAPLGVVDAGQLRELADVVERHGEKMLRATNWQTAVLRWVSSDELPALASGIASMGLPTDEPPILRQMVTCAGAATCRLGICLSRGLAKAIRAALVESDLDLNGATGEVSIHISGCPNACGRHRVAQIGLSGAARRVNGRLAPHYVVQFGGHVEEGRTELASGAHMIPARGVPAYVVELLGAFERSPEFPDFTAFLNAGARNIAPAQVLAQNEDMYYDWDARELFSLAGRGPGECGAGVFDLIEVDLASAADALEAHRLFTATALSARALLVTRGAQADTDRQALELFLRHFIGEGVVAASFKQLIEKALHAAPAPDPEAAFGGQTGEVANLLDAVRRIYETMGPSLHLHAAPCFARQV